MHNTNVVHRISIKRCALVAFAPFNLGNSQMDRSYRSPVRFIIMRISLMIRRLVMEYCTATLKAQKIMKKYLGFGFGFL